MYPSFTATANLVGANLVVCDNYSRELRLMHTVERDGCVAVLVGRLYYLKELADRLKYGDHDSSPDHHDYARVAIDAYVSLGIDAVTKLEGDFALVIWDGVRRRLIAVRDPLGGYPLYWTKTVSGVAVSTSIRSLKPLLSPIRLNQAYIAEYLMMPGAVFEELQSEACPFEGIYRLRAGHLLVWEAGCDAPLVRKYWDWLEQAIDPGTSDVEELGGRFAELLRRATSERLIGSTLCHLSGGFDSTAVTMLAREAVCGRSTLHTGSLVFSRFTSLAAEQEYVNLVLRECPDLVPHRLLADGCAGYGDIPFHEEPWPGIFWSRAERELLRLAEDAKLSTVLTGIGADEQLALEPFHLTDEVRHGHFRRAWKEAGDWAAELSCNRWSIFYPYALVNCLPPLLRGGPTVWLRRGYSSWHAQIDATIPPWVVPRFAHEQHMWRRGRSLVRRMYRSCESTLQSLALFGIECATGDFTRWTLGWPNAIHYAHPFLDPRVVTFSLGMQTRINPNPGEGKAVLTSGLSDMLPTGILDRGYTGDFNDYYFVGLAESRPLIAEYLHDPSVAALDIFDCDEILRCLDRTAFGVAKDVGTVGRLELALSLVLWLSVQRTSQASAQSITWAWSSGQREVPS